MEIENPRCFGCDHKCATSQFPDSIGVGNQHRVVFSGYEEAPVYFQKDSPSIQSGRIFNIEERNRVTGIFNTEEIVVILPIICQMPETRKVS